MTKNEGKEEGNTLKHEASRSINHKATQQKNNTGTTALERSVALTTGVLKIFLTVDKLHLSPDVFLNMKIHKKFVSHNSSLTKSTHDDIKSN